MTNTTTKFPAESTAACTDTDKELVDTIDAKDMHAGEQLAKVSERSGTVSGRSGTISGLMSDDQGTA